MAALKGGSGKTIISLGLISAWRNGGCRVSPFKKGPDFIDAGWLSLAAERPCYNLDPFLMSEAQILQSFVSHSVQSQISLVEGNRGLFDGMDLEGRYSTAELAKLIGAPVVIIVDVTMATRTIAALIMGCQKFDPDLKIAGVILNRIAGPRQNELVSKSIERFCGIPVLGSVPKLKENLFPERHMGLLPHQEREHARKALKWARTLVEDNIEIDLIGRIARDSITLDYIDYRGGEEEKPSHTKVFHAPRIGFIRDSSFWFYYPENLEHLRKLDATLVELDAMSDSTLPELDALYIGGGFPETRAQKLADNKRFRDSLRDSIENGLPVYAECGGLIYLGEALLVEGKTYPKVGSLPIRFVMEEKPQGHGYTILKVDGENPYYQTGEVIKGHEFHYSRPIITCREKLNTVFRVVRGHGLDGKRDGLVKNNLLATYTHVHAGGNRLWGESFLRVIMGYKKFVKKNTKMGIK